MNYSDLITSLSELHQSAQAGAVKSVNRFLVLRNWLYGAYLVKYEQQGEDRAAYGTGLLERLAKDLRARGVKGLGVSILRLTRRFFELYPQIRQSAVTESGATGGLQIRQSLITESATLKKGQPVVGEASQRLPSLLPASKVLEFSWTHLIELIRLDDPWKRAFYENECLKGNWSVRQLQRQISSLLYDRTALSTDKQAVIEHARQQAAEAPALLADIIRDPYALEFLAFAEGRFLNIHPFRDFNGVTIRVFLAELLRRPDYPLVDTALEGDDARARCFAAIEATDRRDWQPLIAIWRPRITEIPF